MPVVLTSGYSDVLAQEGTRGFELLRKPYSIDELASALVQSSSRAGKSKSSSKLEIGHRPAGNEG
jgi:hypothetical protein